MIRTQKAIFWDLVFLFLGVTLVLAVMPLVVAGIATIQDLYDEGHPPVRMSLYSAEKTDESTLRMRFMVTREKECDFVRMTGYSGRSGSPLESAVVLRREDGYQPQSYPVGSTIVSPPWIMYPVFGPRVVLYGYYDCDGRLIRPKVIDQEIAP